VKKLGIDLDGVVARFTESFLFLANARFGTSATPEDQTDWSFEQFFTKAMIDQVWTEIKLTKNFWGTLKLEKGISRLYYPLPAELIFVTSRIPTLGKSAQQQSAHWLRSWFPISHPYVIVVPEPSDKAPVCKALEIDAFIDDKPSTVLQMHNAGIRSYLRQQPYNNHREYPEGVRVVANLDEFLQEECSE
jgi:uncharacterized HAD superfamily protein